MRGDIVAFKEIVTKAVIGKGKKYFKNKYSIICDNKPTTVLGCWVINHQFKGYKQGDNIGVDGSFDVNIWYSYEDDSKTTVVNKNYFFRSWDIMPQTLTRCSPMDSSNTNSGHCNLRSSSDLSPCCFANSFSSYY